MQQKAPTKPVKIRGYLYVLIQTFTIPNTEKEVSCHLSLGQSANCQTKPHLSGSQVNEVFLIEVPQEMTRLVAEFKQDSKVIAECRYDIDPFFDHIGSAHAMTSQIMNTEQEKQGTVNVKITYFSSEFGKIKLRVFHLSMKEAVIEQFKKAKLKAKIGLYSQSSALWDMSKEFDETLQLLVLSKNSNLEFDVVHEEGTLAKYTIYDIEKTGLLINQTKAYQVSLFNNDKAIGTIKYQIDWIH